MASYYGYPPDPVPHAPYYQNPSQQYPQYQQQPPYPTAPPTHNGYQPSSPQQAQPPMMRPHTTAPASYGVQHPPPPPPLPQGYYGSPSSGQQASASAQNGVHHTSASPSAGDERGKLHSMLASLEPGTQDELLKYLSDLRLKESAVAADRAGSAAPPLRPHSASNAASGAAMPPPAVPPPQQSQHMYSPYSQPSVPARSPAPLNGAHTPVGYATEPAMPGSFYDPPVSAPMPLSNTPRPENNRRTSEQYSENSYASSSTTTRKQKEDMSILYDIWGGDLVEPSGHGPKPKQILMDFLTSIANYLVREIEPKNSIVITEEKLRAFYSTFAMPEETVDWKNFFTTRSYSTLSRLFARLRCEHHLIPVAAPEIPTVPGLTPKGFETWMFIQIMLHPSNEHGRLQRVLDKWPIHNGRTNERFPKQLPRKCLPGHHDQIMRRAWWDLKEQHPPDQFTETDDDGEEDEEEENHDHIPHGRTTFTSIRGGDLAPDPVADAADEPFTPPPLTRNKTSRPYSLIPPLPHEFLTKEEREGEEEEEVLQSPAVEERARLPYVSTSKNNANWREDLNPRPTLGEEPSRRQSTRGRSAKPPSDTASSNRRDRHARRARSRARLPSPERRSWSGSEDEDEDRPMRKIERPPSRGVRRDYDHAHTHTHELYDDPPSPYAVPHSHGPSSHDRYGRSDEPGYGSAHRARSRPPAAAAAVAAAPKPDKEEGIDQYRYQTDYRAATGRPRGNTAGSAGVPGGLPSGHHTHYRHGSGGPHDHYYSRPGHKPYY